MSWQGESFAFPSLRKAINFSFTAYVDTNLVGSGKIAKAAILGQAGGVWASSAGYTVWQLLFYYTRT